MKTPHPIQKLNTVVKVLDKTIENPVYDRRCKYGEESISKVLIGTRMIVNTYLYTDCNNLVKHEVNVINLHGITRINSYDFCNLLVENSTETAPSNTDFVEMAALKSDGDIEIIALKIINIMLRDGMVNADAVNTALDILNKSYDTEELK